MGFCTKCGGPVEDGQTVCENCRVQQEQSVSEAASAEEIKLAPITELDEQGQHQPDLTETIPFSEEKPNNKKTVKIIAIVACALVVLIGLFFIGKTFFGRDIMQLVIGKSRYAQNIEQAATQSASKQLVKSIDQSVALTKTTKQNKAVEMEITNKLAIEDACYTEMNLGSEGTAAVKQAMQYFNSLTFKTNVNTNSSNLQSLFTMSDKAGVVLSVGTTVSKEGKAYIQLPEISKKYLLASSAASYQSLLDAISNVKYDSNKLNASLNKIMAAYSDAVGKAAITTQDDQTLTVDGVIVQGQKLTSTLNAEQTTAMEKAVLEAAKSDEYLYTVISENYPAIVAELNKTYSAGIEQEKITKESYAKYFDDQLADLAANKDQDTFSASSYISRDGTVLAHCYEIMDKNGTNNINILFPKNSIAVSMTGAEKDSFIFSNITTGQGAGKMQIKIKSLEDPANVGATIDYSGCKTVKFMGADQLVGKFKISLYDPDNSLVKSFNSESEIFKKLGSSTLTIENSLTGTDKLTTTVGLSLPGLATYSMNAKSTGKTSQTIAIPSDAGQIIDLNSGNAAVDEKKYLVDSLTYASGLMDSHSDLAAALKNFGVTKEIISMYLQYVSQ